MDTNIIRNKILSLLERNAKYTIKELSVFLDIPEERVEAGIAGLEKEQIICGYGALINWDKTDSDFLTALIEVKVSPVRGQGFNSIAERIGRFDEVKSLYLMSGGFDLAIIVEGRSLKDIAAFVSDKLSPLESVLSTATHFVLKKYKDHGIVFDEQDCSDERMIVSP